MMRGERHAIVVDNDKEWREMHCESLHNLGFEVAKYGSERLALKSLLSSRPHVAVVHFKEDPQRSLEFIERLAKRDSSISIIYVTFFKPGQVYPRASKAGVFEVVHKDNIARGTFEEVIERAYATSLRKRESEATKTVVFVAMPFSARFRDRYHLGIKTPLEALGVACLRVDEATFVGSIMEKVRESIAKARLVVADITGKNANVFYEIGYAHALGKPVVLLTETADDIVFDLNQYRHIIYGKNLTKLKDQLVVTVKEVLGM